MLRILSIFIIVALLASSCKKENNRPSLSGVWELRVDYNGQGGKTEYPAGNGKTLVFTNNYYAYYTGSLATDSGTYKLTKESSYITGKIENRIIYNDQQNWVHYLYTLSGDSLTIWLDAYDAGSSLYIKK